MIQIAQNKVTTGAADQFARLHAEFSKKHCVVLPQLLAPNLVKLILKQLESALFYNHSHHDLYAHEFACDLTVRENELPLHLIHFVLNNPRVLTAMQEITGCSTIGSFVGRIYRNLPNNDHRLDWHDDTESRERLLGISINLSDGRYSGGVFQLRHKKTRQIVCEVQSNDPGDTHVFSISPQLQHCVTPVNGGLARTAAAGWFLSTPNCHTALKNLSHSNAIVEKRLA